jgi:hypothetical protein
MGAAELNDNRPQNTAYIVFLQDFANFKTFLRAENRLKTSKRVEKSRRR